MKILVMDDDLFIREFIKEALEIGNHDVEVCETGEEAIAIFKQSVLLNSPFEIVLLDMINNIGLGGPETLLELKKIKNNICSVLITGKKFDKIEQEFKQLGFDGAISKPFSVDALLQLIENIAKK